MFKCKLCGKELKNKRAVHAHLMTTHPEYRESGMKQELFIEGVEAPPETKERPKGFRHLTTANEAERAARGAGFTFVDDYENLYTIEEAKEKGWL